jgi:hypothetical protein
MKRNIAIVSLLAVCLLVAPIAVQSLHAAATAGSWSGWITDEACGAKGASADHKACAEKCAGRGGKLLLYNSADKKLYKLDKQDLAKEHIGHEVTVTGKVDGDAISVDSITMMTKKS